MITDRTANAVIWRSVPIVAVFLLTLAAFEAGVDVTERPGTNEAGLGAHVYYAIGLFFLAGVDLGMPTGGPDWARAMLWIAYFLGPAITTTAVAEGFLALVRPRWLHAARLKGHVVVAGAGPLGQLYADAIRAADPGRHIALVDLEETPEARELVRGGHVTFVRGDILRQQVRSALRLDRAHGLVLTTGSDLHNLEVCWDALGEVPGLRVAVHVSDIGMRRRVGELELRGRPSLFNAHQIAARHLVENHLAKHFQHTDARDIVVIAGFGRFGQTILEYLQSHAQGEVARVVIADLAAGRRARAFHEQVAFDARFPHEVIEGDIDDPRVWGEVSAHLDAEHPEPVVLLCTDDDSVNLRAAMLVRASIPGARSFVRVFKQSRFTDELAHQLEFELLAVERMLGDALVKHFTECFSSESRP